MIADQWVLYLRSKVFPGLPIASLNMRGLNYQRRTALKRPKSLPEGTLRTLCETCFLSENFIGRQRREARPGVPFLFSLCIDQLTRNGPALVFEASPPTQKTLKGNSNIKGAYHVVMLTICFLDVSLFCTPLLTLMKKVRGYPSSLMLHFWATFCYLWPQTNYFRYILFKNC